jgi:hypothetical protein
MNQQRGKCIFPLAWVQVYMSRSAEIALVLLALCLTLGGVFWSGMTSGISGFFMQRTFSRTDNPLAFWLGQTILAALAMACLGWAILTAL